MYNTDTKKTTENMVCRRREIDWEMGRRSGNAWGDCWSKSCLKRKQRGIPIRETDEGTAEDDSNIWQSARRWWTERGDEEKMLFLTDIVSASQRNQNLKRLPPKSSLYQTCWCVCVCVRMVMKIETSDFVQTIWGISWTATADQTLRDLSQHW